MGWADEVLTLWGHVGASQLSSSTSSRSPTMPPSSTHRSSSCPRARLDVVPQAPPQRHTACCAPYIALHQACLFHTLDLCHAPNATCVLLMPCRLWELLHASRGSFWRNTALGACSTTQELRRTISFARGSSIVPTSSSTSLSIAPHVVPELEQCRCSYPHIHTRKWVRLVPPLWSNIMNPYLKGTFPSTDEPSPLVLEPNIR
jgi:hypothetical protein